MKKIKYLVLLLVATLLIPVAVFATDEEAVAEEAATEEVTAAEDTTATSNEVNVYFFRGEGCPHCEEAEQWFQSIEEEYGSYFKIVDYETWYNEENAKLMEKVADIRGEEASGVPYIIVGDKSWNGFTKDYGDEILSQIQTVFAQDVADRYDVMKYLDGSGKDGKKDADKGGNDALILILILVICGGLGFGIYKARETAK